MQPKERRSAVPYDFDVPPEHFLRVSGAERFHGRFLGGEAAREMDVRVVAPLAVGDFSVGEHATHEPIAPALDHGLYAADVRGVETETDDIGHDDVMILPTPAAGFAWRDFSGWPGLVCLPLEPVAPHVFTTAAWPTGSPYVPADARDPWEPVARAVGVSPTQLVRLRQVHGVGVFVAPGSAVAAGPALPEADIVLVGEPGVAGGIQVADCVPLLVADRVRGVVAAAHAGWRGLAANGPRVAVEALASMFGTRPSEIIAALGPSIGACCYEVGPDVRERFVAGGFETAKIAGWFHERRLEVAGNPPLPRVAHAAQRPNRWFFDGWAAAGDQLREAGVPAEQIFAAGLCTASHPGVFCSYRRDGSPSGRLAAAVTCRGCTDAA